MPKRFGRVPTTWLTCLSPSPRAPRDWPRVARSPKWLRTRFGRFTSGVPTWSSPGSEDGRMFAEVRTRVRRALASESLDDVAGLQHLSFTSPWSADAIGWELRETDVARLYVLEEEASAGPPEEGEAARLLAYCACWVIFDELHINSLAVAPDVRRRRYATRLLDHVFQDVVAEG